MTPHEMHEIRPSAGRSGPQRLLPIAGVVVVVLVMLAHIVGGAVLAHASLGSIPGNLGGALAVGLVAIVTLKLLLLLGCGAAGVVGGKRMLAHTSKAHSGMTTGKTIHGARRYDLFVALLTLGRAGALRDRTIELARITPGEDVLDVGCGTGEIAMRAKVRTGPTGSVAGIDPAPEMIAMARGWWTMSYKDRAKMQYQADQIGQAIGNVSAPANAQLQAAYQQGWIDGCNALLAKQAEEAAQRDKP